MNNDLISRQAAIDAIDVGAELLRRVLDETDVVGAERTKYEWGLGLIESCISDTKDLPSAQPDYDLSDYSDRLWQSAYERGKAEAEVKQGKWIWMGEKGDSRFMCSVCKSKENVPTCNGKPTIWWYCPNCGADMRKEAEDD